MSAYLNFDLKLVKLVSLRAARVAQPLGVVVVGHQGTRHFSEEGPKGGCLILWEKLAVVHGPSSAAEFHLRETEEGAKFKMKDSDVQCCLKIADRSHSLWPRSHAQLVAKELALRLNWQKLYQSPRGKFKLRFRKNAKNPNTGGDQMRRSRFCSHFWLPHYITAGQHFSKKFWY